MNHTCRKNDKKAQCSNHSPKVSFKAVTFAATAPKKATAITCNVTTKHISISVHTVTD